MKLRLNKPLKNYKAGQVVSVKDNDRYWLRRLKDASIDNCVEQIDVSKKKHKNLKNDEEIKVKGGGKHNESNNKST